jgi:hypothetical protein
MVDIDESKRLDLRGVDDCLNSVGEIFLSRSTKENNVVQIFTMNCVKSLECSCERWLIVPHI